MAGLLAIVRTDDEARAAAEAGAAVIAIAVDASSSGRDTKAQVGNALVGPLLAAARSAPDRLRAVREAATKGYRAIWLPLDPDWHDASRGAVAAGLIVTGVVSPDRPFDRGVCEEAEQIGLERLLLGKWPSEGRRIVDRHTIAGLANAVALCRSHGLRLTLAGGLEAPDVPRLLALGIDELGFDTLLRDAQDRFDSRLLREADALMQASRIDTLEPALQGADEDRIFVRGWTVPMRIGAYARERGQTQRVRFTVEADVLSSGAAKGMAGIVSYDLITDAIARIADAHVDLVETVAEQLAAAVLLHPRVIRTVIEVEKLDVGPGAVGCRIVRRASP